MRSPPAAACPLDPGRKRVIIGRGHMIDLIQSSAIAAWVRESPSLFGYTTVLALHAMGLAIVVGINAAVALRLLGVAREIPLAPLTKLFPWMYVGFGINAVSGFALLAANASSLLANTVFLTKLVLVAFAVVNLELTRTLVFRDAAVLVGGAIPLRARQLAVTSLAFWGAAIVMGRLAAYPNLVSSLFGF